MNDCSINASDLMDDLCLDLNQVEKVESLRNSGYSLELCLLSVLADGQIKQARRKPQRVDRGLYRVTREGDTIVVYTETGTWQNNPQLFELLDRFDAEWPTSCRFIAFRKLSQWFRQTRSDSDVAWLIRHKAIRPDNSPWLTIPAGEE